MRKEETFPVAVLSGAKMKLILFGIASRMIKCYEQNIKRYMEIFNFVNQFLINLVKLQF